MQLKARPGVAASSVALSYSRPLKNELPAKTPAQQVARPASHAVAREMGVRAQFPVRPCCLLWAGEREIGIRPQFHYTCAPFQHCNSGRRRSDFGVGLPFHCACAPFEHCISGRKCSDFGVRSPFRCAFAPFVHCISGRRRSDFGVGSQLLADSVNHCSRRQKAIGLRPQYHGPGPESPKNNSCQRIFHGGYRPIWPEIQLKARPGAAESSVAQLCSKELPATTPAPQIARPACGQHQSKISSNSAASYPTEPSQAMAREMGVRAQFPVRPCCLLWCGEREIGIRPQFHCTFRDWPRPLNPN